MKENGNTGTDHGGPQPIFMIGGQGGGDLYSTYASLANLDSWKSAVQRGFQTGVCVDTG
ncbi:MAG: hypothetical protein ABSE82_06575 [Nitrososphaerales archaeon]